MHIPKNLWPKRGIPDDIQGYLEQAGFVDLEMRDGEIKGPCPFAVQRHSDGVDAHPSWRVNAKTGYWHCFSCGAGGKFDDLVDQLGLPRLIGMGEHKDTEFRQWASELRRSLGLDSTVAKDTRHWPLPDTFTLFKRSDTHRSAQYLASIGVTWQSVIRYGIGYDCDRGDLIYPIPDKRGRQVAWQRRLLPPNDYSTPYLVPAEFDKSRFLYGIHAIGKRAFVVEGIKAAILVNQWGLPTVASLNAFISARQVELMARVSDITLLLDGDQAGRQGVKDATPLFARLAARTYKATLPDRGKKSSPDDFPFETVRTAIDKREPLKTENVPTETEIRKKLDAIGSDVIR